MTDRTDRSRPPTDPQQPAVHDPEQRRRARTPTKKGTGIEIGTPTTVMPPRHERAASAGDGSPRPATGAERSEPIRVISMKASSDAAGPAGLPAAAASSEERPAIKQHQPRLRRLSEVSPQRRATLTPPGGLGYLAPPRDPRGARARRWREYVIGGSVMVILAGVVMLAVWFLAGM